jgi:membrane protein
MVSKLKAFWESLLARWNWLAHALRAWKQLGNTNGSLLAAALTFLSFLALFPLILLGVSVTGFVLKGDPSLQTKLLNHITSQAPGTFGTTLKNVVSTAIKARTGVGIVGLVTTALTGLGWISNLRVATEQVWGHQPPKRSFVQAKAADSIVLFGLGLGLLASVVLTVAGSALTSHIIAWLSLDSLPGASPLTRVVAFGVAVLGDMVLFAFLLVRLPKAQVPRGVAVRASLLASVGFEVLKLVGTIYIAKISKSPTAGIFGSVVGILVFLNLVFRFLLYCTAWTATATPNRDGGTASTAPPQPGNGMPADGPSYAHRVEAGVAARQPSRGIAVALMLGAWARRGRK